MKYLLLLLLTISTQLFAQYSEKKQGRLDSLNLILEKASHDTTRVQMYLALTDELYFGNSDTIEHFSALINDLVDENLASKNLTKREKFVFQKAQGDAISNLGFLRSNRGSYVEGLELYFQGLAIREKINDTLGLSSSYNNISTVYNKLDAYDKSLEYCAKSLEMRRREGDSSKLALVYNNIAYIYDHLGNKDSAIYFYSESNRLYKELGNKSRDAMTLANLAEVLISVGDTTQGMELHFQSLELRRSINSKSGLAYSLHNIASILIKQGKYKEAEPYIFEQYQVTQKIKNPEYHMRAAKMMYLAYKYKGNYKKSLSFYERFIHLQDSLQNKEIERELVRQEFNFEFQKKTEQDSIKNAERQKVHEAELAAEKAENEKREQQAYYLYGIIALILIFGFFIFNRFLITRKQKAQIEEQKIIVEEKNNEILDSINYAKGIQEAILPTADRMQELLGEHFVLYHPKDIVAGDFYWVDQIEGITVFAAADCTGHGVPGAMVSVVCHNALHRSIHEFNLSTSNSILDKTRELVIETFETTDRVVKDGMDIALGAYNKVTGC